MASGSTGLQTTKALVETTQQTTLGEERRRALTGIYLYDSSNNHIIGNEITNNWIGSSLLERAQ